MCQDFGNVWEFNLLASVLDANEKREPDESPFFSLISMNNNRGYSDNSWLAESVSRIKLVAMNRISQFTDENIGTAIPVLQSGETLKRKYVKWQVYSLPGRGFAVSNLITTLMTRTKELSLKVAKGKNRHKRAS